MFAPLPASIWVNKTQSSSDCLFFNPNNCKCMKLIALSKSRDFNRRSLIKTLLAMKLVAVVLLVSCLQVNAKSNAQSITLSEKNTSLEKVIKEIKKQTGYDFWYENKLLQKASKINIKVDNATLEQALELCFKNQPITWSIVGKIIVLKEIEEEVIAPPPPPPPVEVKGRVTNEKDEPLEGATVTVKGTPIATKTTASGDFVISVPDAKKLLIISSVGYEDNEVRISSSNIVAVILKVKATVVEEVVVTGYTTQRKKDLTGAVSVLKVSDALKETNANLLSSVQGRLAGVSISTDGTPGTNASINIRGLGSIRNNRPLFVVDGVPTLEIDGLSPNDIESFQVLKDAASASIYGARASNGVILITTKKGKSRNVSVTFDAFYGLKTRRDHLDMLNANEYGQVLFQALKNDGLPTQDAIYGNGPDPVIPEYLDDNKTIPSGDVDYQKEVYRPAYNQSYNLGFSKSADKSNFYFGLNHNKEQGLAAKTNFERYTARVNSSFQISDKVTVGENISISNFNTVDIGGGALPAVLYQHPIIPIKDNLGNWGGPVKNLGDRLSPLGELERNKDNKKKTWRAFGNAFANVKLFKGFAYNVNLGVDVVNYRFKFFEPTYVEGRFSNTDAHLTETSSNALNLTISHTLNYQWTKSAHDVKALVGYEWINNKFESYSAKAKDFFVETTDFRYLSAGAEMESVTGGGTELGIISQFAKVDYKFDDRYLLSGTIRRDGSSRFGPENRYAIFPAASFAWRISEEGFFGNKMTDKISDLKLRVSWGKNGNQEIGDYTYSTFYSSQPDFSNYDASGTNTSAQQGFATTQIGNSKIKWETAIQTNIGVDAGLLNNRIYLSADYFIKNTKDLLVNPLLQAVRGEGNPPFINAGNIRNSGLEFLLSYRNNGTSKFKYNLDLTFTSIKNKVISVGEDGKSEIIGSYSRITPGQPLGVFYGYKADGLFRSQREVDDHASQGGKGLGRIRFSDINGDGAITPDDRTFLGSPLPKYMAGLNFNGSYENFDIAFFFDASAGNKIWDRNRFNTHFILFNSNHGKVLLNAWSPTNPDSDIPALTTQNTNDEQRASSFFLSDGSYLRLKSAVVGYTIPKKVTDRIKITRARIFLQGQNLLNFTRFEGLDYEVLNTGTLDYGVLQENAYPHSKSVHIGISVGF